MGNYLPSDAPFGATRDCEYGTFCFSDSDRNDGIDRGSYHYVNLRTEYEYEKKSLKTLASNLIEENGTYEANQTHDEHLTTTICITIQESTIPKRVGISFSCKYWFEDPQNAFEAYFSNAKQLTCGLAASDTILTYAVKTSVSEGNTTWSNVKRIFQTK